MYIVHHSKVVKLCGQKWKTSPSVRKQLKTCKTLYSKWKSSGQNMDHHTYLDLVKEKQKLKSTQRMEKAIDRTHLYKKIRFLAYFFPYKSFYLSNLVTIVFI
jgi:hypothetical protein